MIHCINHKDTPSVMELDGENLCQKCADEWLAGERQSAFEQEEMAAYLAWKDDAL